MALPQLTYVPAPNEQSYYEGLFQAADIQRKGYLGGAEAVQFFTRSKLTVETLKQIWTVADRNPTTNTLDRTKFAIAVRLIQLAQNGVKAQGSTLGGPPNLRPVLFEGVSGVSVPMPTAMSQPPPTPSPAPTAVTTPSPMVAPPTTPAAASIATPIAAAPPPVMSNAITTQDPYAMTPPEQARYEALFPNYAQQDGFVYGKEAVELFGKSGVAQDQLGAIWNMVDSPVDNRLDELEFAFAMHLIVCVSKKGLPLPQSLPISLKQLKQQKSESGGGFNAEQRASQMTNPDPAPAPPSIPDPVGPPALPSLQNPPEAPPTLSMQTPPQQQSLAAAPGQIAAPVVAGLSGGVADIHDAFEGLSTTDTYLDANYGAAAANTTGFGTMGAAGMGMGMGMGSAMGNSPKMAPEPVVETIDDEIPEPEPAPVYSAPKPVPVPAPPPKSAMQLAAEYQQGDDLTELAKLKTTLQKLQAENISLKAQLGSMTEEEREVQKETSAVVAEIGSLSSQLTDLRAQVLASKTKLLESTAELTAAKEKKEVISDLISQTQATKDALESANAGLDDAQVTLTAPPPAAAPAPTIQEADLFGGWGAPSVPAPAPAPSFGPQPGMLGSVDDDDDDDGVEDMTPGGVPAYGSYGMAPAPTPAAPAPIPAPAPAMMPNDPQQLKFSSTSFGFGAGIMGGDAGLIPTPTATEAYNSAGGGFDAPDPTPAPVPAPAPMAAPKQAPSMPQGGGGGGAISQVEVEQIKASAIRAEETSREAEDTYRTLAVEAQKLQHISSSAEMDARQKTEKAAKKKGLGKKKAQKEAEAAQQDAAEKKKHYLEMQAQATNAQKLVMESKREADTLRQQAEQAELDMVAAKSAMEASQLAAPVPAAPVPAPAPYSNGGYNQYGNGGSESFGFGAGIMGGAPDSGGSGGGGFRIPSPTNDAYANPF